MNRNPFSDDDRDEDDEEQTARDKELQALVEEYEQADGAQRLWALDQLLDIIDFYDEAGRYEEALAAAEIAIEQHPYDALPYIRKSHFLLELDRVEESSDALDKAALYDPGHEEIAIFRAEILTRQGHYEEALEIITRLRAERPDEADQHDIALVEAHLWESKGDFAQAFDNLYSILKNDPRSEAAGTRARHVLSHLDDIATVIEPLRRLTDKDPYSGMAWLLLAYALGENGQDEEAIEAYELAIVAEDAVKFAYFDYVDFLFNTARYEQARNILHECSRLKMFEGDPFIFYRMGECWQAEGELVQALNYYKRALEIDHLDGYVYFQMGNLYREFHLPTEAQQAYETAIQTNDEQPFFFIALAQLHAAQQEPQKADELFGKAIKLQPRNVDLWAAYLAFVLAQEEWQHARMVINILTQNEVDDDFCAYATVALGFASKQEQQAYVLLALALKKNIDYLDYLYAMLPALEKDEKVQRFISEQ